MKQCTHGGMGKSPLLDGGDYFSAKGAKGGQTA